MMKSIAINYITIFCLFVAVLFTSACKKNGANEENITPTEAGSASFKARNVDFVVSKPYNGIFVDNGVTNNSVELKSSDGTTVTISFKGTSPGTYSLKGLDAVYKDKTGKKYNATKGALVVTYYSVNGALKLFSGTFSFTAQSIATVSSDLIEITDGKITNCSNSFN